MYLTFRLPSRSSPSHISASDCSQNRLDVSKYPEVPEKATTSRLELLDVIQYLPELEVAVCTTCRVAVCFDEVDRHLYSRHGGCHFSIRRAVAQRLQSSTMPRTLDELRPRPDGVPPLECLVTPLQGFFCPLCPSYKTTYYPSLRKHVNKQHGARCGSTYTSSTQSCFLQRWTDRRSKDPGYWKVDATAVPELQSHIDEDSNVVTAATAQDIEDQLAHDLAVMEGEEERRLAEEYDEEATDLDNGLEHNTRSDWLRGCNWQVWFANKPRRLIVNVSRMPKITLPAKSLPLGTWCGLDCVSESAEEHKLAVICVATHHVLDRCKRTLEATPRTLRCWLKSWSHTYQPYDFKIPQSAAESRYKQSWCRFISYVYRVRALERRLYEQPGELSSLYLTSTQSSAMDRVWSLAHNVQFTSTERKLTGSEDTIACLLESLFELFLAFWTDRSNDGNLERTPVANFSGVLGIDPSTLAFRKPYNYTTNLSALIWVGRLLLLEYALPLRPYLLTKVQILARDSYSDYGQRLCSDVRPLHLQRGSMSPIGYLIERLQHGRAIAKREGPPATVRWSLDGRTLHAYGADLTMGHFRQMISNVVECTAQQVEDMVFRVKIPYDLSTLHDSMCNDKPGYSFLTEPRNGLRSSFRSLTQVAFSKAWGFSMAGGGRQKAYAYLRGQKRLIKSILATVHLTSGMPGRGSEIGRMQWVNTIGNKRNVFVYNGQIILVFPDNKATTNHDNSFYIVRNPCSSAQKSIFVYLAYIRPFCEFLRRQLDGYDDKASTSPFLFPRYSCRPSHFLSENCSESLVSACEHSPFPMNFHNYRNTVVSISKKHLPHLVQFFDPDSPHQEDGCMTLFAFQTGHNPRTRSRAYALETGFPARLQPELIERYLQNSRYWHKFICQLEDQYDVVITDCSLSNKQGVYAFPEWLEDQNPGDDSDDRMDDEDGFRGINVSTGVKRKRLRTG